MNGTDRTRGLLRSALVSAALIIVTGLVLAALGPFGSFEGSFAERLGYWLAAVLIGYLVFRPVVWLGDRIARGLALPRSATLAFAVGLGAVPATLGIAWLNGGLRSGLPPLANLAPLYLNVVLVGALVTLLFLAIARRGPAPVAAPASVPDVPTPAGEPARPLFLERLPADWRGELVALEMEDHYVRAHGPDRRSLLILMRMADAERELAGLDGLRVHRSWWVPRHAVEAPIRDGRRLSLALTGGLQAPVARDRVAELRKAGWL